MYTCTATAVRIRVAKLIGKGHASKAQQVSILAVVLIFGFSTTVSLTLVLFRDAICRIFTHNEHVLELMRSTVIFTVVFLMLDSLISVGAAIVVALAKHTYLVVFYFGAYYVVGLPLMFLLVYVRFTVLTMKFSDLDSFPRRSMPP